MPAMDATNCVRAESEYTAKVYASVPPLVPRTASFISNMGFSDTLTLVVGDTADGAVGSAPEAGVTPIEAEDSLILGVGIAKSTD